MVGECHYCGRLVILPVKHRMSLHQLYGARTKIMKTDDEIATKRNDQNRDEK